MIQLGRTRHLRRDLATIVLGTIESSPRRYQTSYCTNGVSTLTRRRVVIFQEIITLPLLIGIFHPVTSVLPAHHHIDQI